MLLVVLLAVFEVNKDIAKKVNRFAACYLLCNEQCVFVVGGSEEVPEVLESRELLLVGEGAWRQ